MSDERNTEERWRDLEREVKDPPMKFIVEPGNPSPPTAPLQGPSPELLTVLEGIHYELRRIADAARARK